MSRLASIGFELNSTTSDVEWTSSSIGATVVTSPVRSGTYAGRTNPSGGTQAFTYTFGTSASSAAFYTRAYIRFASFPIADSAIIILQDSAGTTSAQLRFINATSKLRLRDNGAVTIGSDSAALSLNTWYMVEVMQDDTNTTMKARLDGVEFASSTSVTAGNINPINQYKVGPQTNPTTTDMFIDDVAINNTSGSFQNSWPGAGSILHLRPSAVGDNADWTDGTGSTFAEVDEVTPDDATTYIAEIDAGNTATQKSDFNLDNTPAGIGSGDTINVVQVGVRFTLSSSTGVDPTFVTYIKASSGGTIEESGSIAPTSTTWLTNAVAVPRNYPLTLYDLPGASTTAWAKSNLDAALIGVRHNGDEGFDAVRVSTLWLLVEYVPASDITTTKTITGVSRIQVTTTKTETGVARITNTTTRTETGVSRIMISTTRTETGLARVQKAVTRTETGVARVTKTTAQTISGVANIAGVSRTLSTDYYMVTFGGTVTTTQDITGKSRIQLTTTKTESGVARITVSTTRNITGVARITAATTRTITGKADITATTPRTVTGVARIQKAVTQTESGVSRVQVSTTRNVTGVARITIATSRTEQGVARITVTSAKTETGVARVQKAVTQNVTGVSRIQLATTRTETGVARISAITPRTITGVARVTKTTIQTETGVAKITGGVGRNITGVARIAVGTTRTETGVSRIQITSTKTVTGKARLQLQTIRTETGVARITGVTTQNITGVASIISTGGTQHTLLLMGVG